jgi:hypothetical protein
MRCHLQIALKVREWNVWRQIPLGRWSDKGDVFISVAAVHSWGRGRGIENRGPGKVQMAWENSSCFQLIIFCLVQRAVSWKRTLLWFGSWMLSKSPCVSDLVPSPWCYWEVIEYLGGRNGWKEVRSLRIWLWRGYWNSASPLSLSLSLSLSLILGCHKFIGFLCHVLLPWCAKGQVSKTRSQNRPFLLSSGLSQAFVTVTDVLPTYIQCLGRQRD